MTDQQGFPGPPADDLAHLRVVRVGELCGLLDISRATLWRMRKRGEIPPPRRFSTNVTGWTRSELVDWYATREAA